MYRVLSESTEIIMFNNSEKVVYLSVILCSCVPQIPNYLKTNKHMLPDFWRCKDWGWQRHGDSIGTTNCNSNRFIHCAMHKLHKQDQFIWCTFVPFFLYGYYTNKFDLCNFCCRKTHWASYSYHIFITLNPIGKNKKMKHDPYT